MPCRQPICMCVLKKQMEMSKIFFTADLHFGHRKILQHLPHRPFGAEQDIAAHDAWLLGLWRSTVGKNDTIYILGDLTFYKSEEARLLLEKLPGRKYLIKGNHDGSVKAYSHYFVKATQLLDLTVKPTVCARLSEKQMLTLCHYPLLDWNNKQEGAVMLHGHCHGTLDEHNRHSDDLRFDVGIDGELAQRCGGFVDLDSLYDAVLEKTGGKMPRRYVAEKLQR